MRLHKEQFEFLLHPSAQFFIAVEQAALADQQAHQRIVLVFQQVPVVEDFVEGFHGVLEGGEEGFF